MIRRLIKLILAHKRGDGRYWRQLYLRAERDRAKEREGWGVERTHLLNQILIKNAASPIQTEPEQPFERVESLTEEQENELAIAEHRRALARNAALDDFEFEKAKLLAQRDPVWRPIVEEARKLREGEAVN